MSQGSVVLDTRPASQYAAGHMPGALNIGLGGQFASWAGTLIKADASILLVAENEAAVREARIRLTLAGARDRGRRRHKAGYGTISWVVVRRTQLRCDRRGPTNLRRLTASDRTDP